MAAALVFLFALHLSAQEKFRIVGTVVKVQATQVDALGHDMFDLVAVEIQITK